VSLKVPRRFDFARLQKFNAQLAEGNFAGATQWPLFAEIIVSCAIHATSCRMLSQWQCISLVCDLLSTSIALLEQCGVGMRIMALRCGMWCAALLC
jgi:hypothetical protein